MKIAIITGASSGIGKEIAIAFDKVYTYDEIWLIARRTFVAESLTPTFRNKVRPIRLDLLQSSDLESFRDLLREEQPEIELLVNAAGSGVFGPFAESELRDMLDTVDLNAKALMAITHHSLPYMKSGSGIINVGSNSSWQPVPYQAVYGASKAMVLSFSRALGRELKSKGIRVMCVCPGWIRTGFQKNAKHDDYIRYVDRWYEASDVAARTLRDYKKKRTVSILGLPVRAQVQLVKHLPTDLIMYIWCRQQGIK